MNALIESERAMAFQPIPGRNSGDVGYDCRLATGSAFCVPILCLVPVTGYFPAALAVGVSSRRC